jgi:hypothetical protein
MLSVQYMVYGSVGKVGGNLHTINLYLVNVETGVTESSATSDQRGIEDLLTQGMANGARRLLGAANGD